MREERRVREEQERAEELVNAPDPHRASSICCPMATGSCARPATCPARRTSTCRCRRCGEFLLRKGDVITGKVREAQGQREVLRRCCEVETVNGLDPEAAKRAARTSTS